MNIITVFEKTTKDVANSYNIIVGTGIIFDKTNKLVLNCTDDVDEKQWSDESLTFDIDGKEVTFYIIERTSYDTIKDMAEVIRIQEMESDLAYMKDHGEHGSGCIGCAWEQRETTELPCKACVDYNFYLSKIKKVVPTDPETLDNTIEYHPVDVLHNNIKSTTMNNICGPLKETFGNPKTLNQQTGFLEPFEYSKLLRLGFSEEYIKNFKKCLDKNTTPAMEEIKIEKQIKESVKILIDYLWSNEMKHFCKGFGVEIQSQDDIQNWINVCENDNNPEKEAMTNHVFYHLMKLKKLYNL